MAEGEGLKLPTGTISIAAAVVVMLATVFTLSGMNGKVGDLTAKVADLQVQVEHLADIQHQIDALDRRLGKAQGQVRDISQARDEIIAAICRILGRSDQTCAVGS